MNNIWYLKYDHKGRFMKHMMGEKFENFKGKLDHVYTHVKTQHDVLPRPNDESTSIVYPILQRVEVFTRCPQAWEDMMMENFYAEKEKLREEILKAMGVVRD
ncbi:MAG: hypothetical protein ACRDDH_11925 [Cetobacterium sp.]|uniref:hypothetical protein n=1 Tax=Cetobacterium sp. TaxID=2071632 RepID=UPI003EE4C10F